VSVVSVAVAALVAVTALLALPAAAGGSRSGKVAPRPSAGCDADAVVAPGEEKVTMTSGGVERWFIRHVPPGYDGTKPLPLVVDLHGYTEGADIHRMHTKLGETGDREGFITLTPHGEGVVPRWDVTLGSPDMEFIGDLLDEAEATLCVDVRRIYATGLSNGAFMTSSLVCAYADRFAAVAPIAGIRQVEDCEPARPVPTVAFHGTADDFVRFDGGIGSAASRLPNPDGSPRTPETTPSTTPAALRPTIPENVAFWADLNGCRPKPRERTIADDVTLVSYRCPGRADVQLYVIEGGGHSWPGSEFSRGIESITGPVTFSIDANDVMWRFFERHPLGSD
jgi:polyhydroxybutyrate depolymerase